MNGRSGISGALISHYGVHVAKLTVLPLCHLDRFGCVNFLKYIERKVVCQVLPENFMAECWSVRQSSTDMVESRVEDSEKYKRSL